MITITSGQYIPPPEPDPELVQNLALNVYQNRPGHWAWDLRDRRDRSLFEGRLEFDTEEQARRSGLSRLTELTRSVREAGAPRVTSDEKEHLVVVSRHDEDLYAFFKDRLGASDGIEVIRDRRKSLARMESRGIDRRSADLDAAIRARGWSIVCRSEHGRRRSQESA
jgi:hypothetical protein